MEPKKRRGPKPREITDPVCIALRQLRETLGDSQEAFARRMKVTTRTIARWETVRPPKDMETLVGLASLADDFGLQGLHLTFWAASGIRADVTAAMTGLWGHLDDADARFELAKARGEVGRGVLTLPALPDDMVTSMRKTENYAVLSAILDAPEKYADELASWRLIRREVERKRTT